MNFGFAGCVPMGLSLLGDMANDTFDLSPPGMDAWSYNYSNSNTSRVETHLVQNQTLVPTEVTSLSGRLDHMATDSTRFQTARTVLRTIQPIICVFGLLGNLLTLFILTRKRLQVSCDGMERTVNFGLTALAVSDLMFCLSLLPYGIIHEQFSYHGRQFQFYYKAYSYALINTFISSSTWLTVSTATSRYLAICHPFKARHLIGMRGTKASILLVFFLCVLFNIPRFFRFKIESIPCTDGTYVYFLENGYLILHEKLYCVYIWIYFSFGISLPLATLAFCNICLVKALRESAKLRKRYRVPAAHVDSNYRITSILVTIVVMYIVLVSPAEILLFLQDRLPKDKLNATFLFFVELTNLLQTLNFSCNFVLYFVLNVHFRRALRDLVYTILSPCCKKRKRKSLKQPLSRRTSSLRTSQTVV